MIERETGSESRQVEFERLCDDFEQAIDRAEDQGVETSWVVSQFAARLRQAFDTAFGPSDPRSVAMREAVRSRLPSRVFEAMNKAKARKAA